MSEPFLGEMRYFGFNFAPRGWTLCNGQTLPINQNQALFALLGTLYGGNGVSTFQLPNLQGRVGVGMGSGPGLSAYSVGQTGGEENHTIAANEMPQHTHSVNCKNTVDNSGTPTSPVGKFWTKENNGDAPYQTSAAGLTAMHASAVGGMGGGQPHPNIQPSLVVTCCIAVAGIFPSRN
jgi:microcystin-dependent protein